MAPANSGYSEKITAIKQNLLTDIMLHRYHPFTVSKLCLRTEDLWKGILSQNFVFSFRNSITLQCYSLLETKLTDMIFSMGDKALEWLNGKKNVIRTCETKLDTVERELLKDIDEDFRTFYSEEKAILELFFSEKGEEEIFEQWKTEFDLKLRTVNEENLSTTKRRINEEIEIKKSQLDHKKYSFIYEEKIPDNVKSLAEELKSQPPLSTTAMRERFDNKWREWMAGFPTPFNNIDIYQSFLTAALKAYQQDQPLMLQAFKKDHRERIQKNFSNCLDTSVTHKTLWAYLNKLLKPFSSKHQSQGEITALQREIECKAHGHSLDEAYVSSLISTINGIVSTLISSGVKFKSQNRFEIYMSVYACQLASFILRKQGKTENRRALTSDMTLNKIQDIDVHPECKSVLLHVFSKHKEVVKEALEDCCMFTQRNICDFDFEEHMPLLQKNTNNVNELISNMLLQMKSIVDETEIQPFRNDYAVRIIRKVQELISNIDDSKKDFRFTKKFKIQIVVHVCMYAIPNFYYENKRYLDKIDPRIVFEKNNKDFYFKMLKNLYSNSGSEKSLADVLAVRICKAIETKVDEDMPRSLAKAVRKNIHRIQRKSVLLPAILGDLLDINVFEEYFLYLKDINSCFDKWIRTYINNYLFEPSEHSGKSRYIKLASQNIQSLISQVCDAIEKVTEKSASYEGRDYQCWAMDFQKYVKEILPLSENDLTKQNNAHQISDLFSFTAYLKTEVNSSFGRLLQTFNDHRENHLSFGHQDSVYSIIYKECKGCTIQCPFCSAPCSRSIDNHLRLNINHSCIEHYPQACGGVSWESSNKLTVESCSVLLVTDTQFKNAETNYLFHPYKTYKEVYPDWDIDADPSVEGSKYWKWFIVQFAEKLSEKYRAELPDIPNAWKTITIGNAKESLLSNSTTQHVVDSNN